MEIKCFIKHIYLLNLYNFVSPLYENSFTQITIFLKIFYNILKKLLKLEKVLLYWQYRYTIRNEIIILEEKSVKQFTHHPN